MIEVTKVNRKLPSLRPSVFVKAAFWVLFIISVLVKCIYFQVDTGLNTASANSPQNIYMFISLLSFLLIFVSFILLFFNRKRYFTLFILDLLLTILVAADTIYFRYYHNAITIPVLLQVGLLGPLGGSIKGLIKSSDIIFIIDFPVLLAGLIFLKNSGVKKIRVYKRLLCFFITIAAGITISVFNFSNINTLWFAYDKNNIISDLGIFYFHYHDATSYIKENTFADKSLSTDEKGQINDFFKNKTNTSSSFKGIAKGKNLIIIQMEAVQQFLINRKINGEEITPNLNKLIKESAYFNNFYYQVGEGNTSDAEFLCNASQYPAKQGAVYFRYPVNTYHTLPKALKSNGYSTYAFHAYHPSFWNRTVMYKAIGFDTFISDKDFSPGEMIGFGLNDTSFFQQSLVKIDKNKPFYGFFITLSSHYAFAPFKNYSFNVGEYENTDFGNYIKAVHYVDKSIGVMIDELKRYKLYDNTVLAVYGDHHSFPKGSADDFKKFLNITNDFEWTENQKVPFILHYPGLKNGETISLTGGEIDIFPTVANLLGIDAQYSFGKDLLNSPKGYAVLRNGSVVTDNYIFVNENSTVYDIKNGSKLDYGKHKGEITAYQHELSVSDIILSKNAFKSLP